LGVQCRDRKHPYRYLDERPSGHYRHLAI
jgi:hypothetical protein